MRLILGKICPRFSWGLCYSWPDSHCRQSKAPMIHCCQGKTLQSLPHIHVRITYYHPKTLQQALVSWTSILWDQLASDETPDYVLGWGNPSGMISCSLAPMGCRINEEIVWEFASVAFPWWHLCTDKKHLAAFLCFVHDVTVLILPDNFMRAATVSNGVHQGLRQLINWEKQGNNRIFPPNPGSPQLLLH